MPGDDIEDRVVSGTLKQLGLELANHGKAALSVLIGSNYLNKLTSRGSLTGIQEVARIR